MNAQTLRARVVRHLLAHPAGPAFSSEQLRLLTQYVLGRVSWAALQARVPEFQPSLPQVSLA